MTQNKTSALVVFSGGQDSTTILAQAKNQYDYVEAISFYYGQKHSIELEQGAKICEKLGVKRTLIDISFLKDICDSALTSEASVNLPHKRLKSLPASFVPNRNTILLTLANTYAQKVGIENLITGTCQTDFSGYPDCRRSFVDSLEATLALANTHITTSPDIIFEILLKGFTHVSYNEIEAISIFADDGEILVQIRDFFNAAGIVAYNPSPIYSTLNYSLTYDNKESWSYIYNFMRGHEDQGKLLNHPNYQEFIRLHGVELIKQNPLGVTNNPEAPYIKIHTPLMYINKAETFALAEQEGALELVIDESATCYNGERDIKHPWGYGCTHLDENDQIQECPACTLRRKGYQEFLESKGQTLDYTPPKKIIIETCI